MDNKENIETPETGKRKPGRNWKESKVIFLVLPIVLTVFFPLGVLDYLRGRFSPYATTMANVSLLYLGTICFIIFCFFASIVKLFRSWKKYSGKKKSLIIAETVNPFFFIA